ncbi:MAG: cobalamin-dependent protein [Candidatus Nanoarchaeia archaeon]|nr:cobalamin-dependent protein [Candidatus Nanoarchaeia archaeon]MDD5741693.1 cobalamin-dependent protein [Candidatus Nanoarchaeia archaeon]
MEKLQDKIKYALIQIAQNIGKKDVPTIEVLVKQAIEEGIEPLKILNEGLVAGMAEVAEQYKKQEIYIPEFLIISGKMGDAMDVLMPYLVGSNYSKGKIVIGTVQGDLHDIGKNIVVRMLKGGGYEVIDLGIDQPPQKFGDAIEKYKPQIVGLSALLTTTLPAMEKTVKYIKSLNSNVKILVGGAPVTQAYADNIGAHGYGADAPSALAKAHELLKK